MGQSNKSGERNPNNPPNPRKGQTMVPYNPLLKYTEEDFKSFQRQARRSARTEFMREIGITDLCSVSTPSSRWFVEADGKDSFPEMINQERGSLCLGNMTDDELAFAVFVHGNMDEYEKSRRIMSGQIIDIGYLMAAKERIRWLSRHLESSLSREEMLTKQLAEHKEKVWNHVIKEHGGCDPRIIRVKAEELLPSEYVDTKLADYAMFHADRVVSRNGIVLKDRAGVSGAVNEEEMRLHVEAVAEEIYSGWHDQPGFKPWVRGGNSLKQDEARRLAREKLAARMANNTKENSDATE